MNTNLQYISQTQTLIGTKSRILIDAETGERIEVDQVTKRAYGQKQFWKLYLFDFLHVLGVLEYKQVDVFIYILENTDPSNNLFIGTYRNIADACKVSPNTVFRVMKKLIQQQFIKKQHNGVWQINPNIVMKGSEHKKSLLINYFNEKK